MEPRAETLPTAISPKVASGDPEPDPLLQAIRAFQQGRDREDAFRVLFERFHPPVRRFFARKGFAPEECLDLTQETFLGIYRGLESFRGDARLETWIFRIATTTWLKRRRAQATGKRRGTEVSRDEEEAAAPEPRAPAGQLDSVIRHQRRQALRRAVLDLPEQMRRCLLLRIERDLKYKEIAAEMQVSIQTVKAHLFQARQRLRQELSDFDALESEADATEERRSP